MLSYTRDNWYWTVAGDTEQVWASKAAEYVSVADATYRAWLAKGGQPTRIKSEVDLAEVLGELWPDHVPPVVERWKARAALRIAGRFDAAAQAVGQIGDPIIQEAFDSAGEWHRASPSVNAMGAAIGLSSAQIDDLFRAAAQIRA